jgi:hypothetical protein
MGTRSWATARSITALATSRVSAPEYSASHWHDIETPEFLIVYFEKPRFEPQLRIHVGAQRIEYDIGLQVVPGVAPIADGMPGREAHNGQRTAAAEAGSGRGGPERKI